MTEVVIWTSLDRILWGVVLSLQLICALKYLIVAKENEEFEQKLILISYSIILIGFMLCTIFSLFAESQIPGTFVNHIFYGNYDKVDSTFKMLTRHTFFFFYAGIIFFVYVFERVLKRTRYTLTIFYGIGLALILILPFELLTTGFFTVLFFLYMAILIASIFLLYTKWSSLEFKAVSSLMLLGFSLILMGASISTESAKRMRINPSFLILGPIFWGVGILICLTPTFVNPKVF